MTDHQLMLLVRDGQIQKLTPLFERHHTHLFNFFLKQTSHRASSEDLVQDVFLRMLKYRHTYREDGQFLTWMFTIAHRVKVDFYKKRQRQHEHLEAPDALPHPDDTPDKKTERADHLALIQQALDRLKPEQREILLMARYDEMKYEDIGTALGLKIGTVKARVHRAMKALAIETRQLTLGDQP